MYLSFFHIPSDLFCGPPGQQSLQFCRFSFFLLLTIMRSGLLAGIRWSVCMLKSHRSLCESVSRTGAGLCIYHLFVWSNWNFLHIYQWITFIIPCEFFHTTHRRWTFTEVRVIGSLLKSPGLLLLFSNLSNTVVWIVFTRPPISNSKNT